jgi:AMMECR1 domain-containing protein
MLINQVRWALISHKKDLFQRNGVYWDIVRRGRDESELRGCQGFLKIVNLG